ncbi:MAG: hypothetical protein PHP42_00415 [Bacteroidota bacterium]|nr:hypothetical protein [Bacteroidota bacterium]
MNTTKKILCTSVLFGVIIFAGCYTQLMTPQEYTKERRQTVETQVVQSENYNHCLSCHSREELDDRYIDLKYYGIHTVHDGIPLDPIAWNDPYASPGYIPEIEYGWPRPNNILPWWLPPAASVTATTQTETKDRTRTAGATRDANDRTRRSEPISTYTPPSTPVGGTSPSTPSPAATVAPPKQTQQSATTNSTGRTKDSTSNTNSTSRTRDSGSTRDDGDRHR